MILSALSTVLMRWATTKTGAVVHDGLERILNLGFGFHIDRAGAVVQNQDLGLGDDGAGDGDALLLSADRLTPRSSTWVS